MGRSIVSFFFFFSSYFYLVGNIHDITVEICDWQAFFRMHSIRARQGRFVSVETGDGGSCVFFYLVCTGFHETRQTIFFFGEWHDIPLEDTDCCCWI